MVVSGAGTFENPYVITGPDANAPESVFAGVAGDGIDITPGGPAGHTPTIAILVDPDSTAPVSVSPTGLRVDCCSPNLPLSIVSDLSVIATYESQTFLADNSSNGVDIFLPPTPTAGTRIEVKDYGEGTGGPFTGNSTVEPITIVADTGAGELIDGFPTFTFDSSDGQAQMFVFDGVSNWSVF